jgi:hypothetical protein
MIGQAKIYQATNVPLGRAAFCVRVFMGTNLYFLVLLGLGTGIDILISSYIRAAMPRKSRIDVACTLHHIIVRAIERRKIILFRRHQPLAGNSLNAGIIINPKAMILNGGSTTWRPGYVWKKTALHA